MDKTIDFKLAEFNEALERLGEALAEKKNDFIRDSVIKRFEFAFELAWKTAKVFLNVKYGVDAHSPKEVFRQLRANGLLTNAEAEQFLIMTDDRNQIIHTYDFNFSKELSDKIAQEYYVLLKNIAVAIK